PAHAEQEPNLRDQGMREGPPLIGERAGHQRRRGNVELTYVTQILDEVGGRITSSLPRQISNGTDFFQKFPARGRTLVPEARYQKILGVEEHEHGGPPRCERAQPDPDAVESGTRLRGQLPLRIGVKKLAGADGKQEVLDRFDGLRDPGGPGASAALELD